MRAWALLILSGASIGYALAKFPAVVVLALATMLVVTYKKEEA